MSMTLSPKFLAHLAQVYAALRPQTLSQPFLSDLKRVYDTLPVASDDNLLFLANSFAKWRKVTKDSIRVRVKALSDDDPLKCPISLFRTMDAGRLEIAHTRTLAWLLDPTREHGFGTTLLVALLRHLSGNTCSGGFRVDWVKSEHPIDGSGARGRLDVLARGAFEDGPRSGWLLVIEAKVDAGEGEDQLQKYETWLRSNARGREVFRVFLTAEGARPTGADEWEPLSFLELVRIFRAAYSGLRHAPGFHFLRFYLAGVLQDVCRLPRNVESENTDPYAVASYLKSVSDFPSEGASHDAAW
jgi:hypothetical protein